MAGGWAGGGGCGGGGGGGLGGGVGGGEGGGGGGVAHGAMAAAALAGAVGSVVLGHWLDAGKGRRAVAFAMAAMAAVVFLRATVPGHPLLAVVATTLGALASCLYTPTLMTAMYNLAKQSP